MNDVFSITLLSHWFTMCSPYVSKGWNSGRAVIFKIAGGPEFWVLMDFYVTISKFFPILASLRRGGLRGLRGPPSPPYGHVWCSLYLSMMGKLFLGSSLTLKVENAFFSALYYSIITTVLWKKGRGQDSYFSTKSDEKINGLWKAQLDTSTFFVSK